MNEDLRQRIKDTAAQMGYKPDRMATALRKGSSATIGVITAFSGNQISFSRSHEICRRLQQAGYDYSLQMVMPNEDIRLERFETALDLLEDYRVQGYIVHQFAFLKEDAAIAEKRLLDTGRPVVLVASRFSEAFPLIDADYFGAGYLMAKHVIGQGRRSVLAISQKLTSQSIEERFRGVKTACDETPGASFTRVRPETHYDNEVEAGYILTQSFPESRPDAIFYSNDRMACGGLNALSEKGVTVPADIAVSGFDGVDIAEYTIPPLTTAVQPVNMMAKKSIELLTEMLRSPAHVPPGLITVPCDVIFRQSSG
jgi:LacI family transcriptional regulator